MTLFGYLLRVTLCFALLYAPYLLFSRKLTYFQWRRFYLLAAGLASVLLPLLTLREEQVTIHSYWLQELLLHPDKTTAAAGWTVSDWFAAVYWTGVAVSAVYFFVRLSRLLYLLLKKTKRAADGVRLLPENYPATAFSFFGFLVLHPSLDEAARRYVLRHERVHIRQGHTFDNLFYEWLRVFFWFNPLYRLAGKQLAETHEFIADEQACGDDAVQYQRVLVAHVLGLRSATLLHPFSEPGSLQSRIKMMTAKRSRKASLLGFLLVIPFMAGLLTLNSFTFITPQVKVGDTVEKMPEFKGGQEAMMKYLTENVRYPEDAKKAKIAGMVVVSFDVEADGSIKNAKVVKSVSPSIDAEALRVVNSMPAWNPGEKAGKAVKAEMNLPIRFALN